MKTAEYINRNVKDVVCFVLLLSVFVGVYIQGIVFKTSKQHTLIKQGLQKDPMKYILIWTKNSTFPLKLLNSGKKAFVDARCNVSDCYVTSDREYFNDHTKFDAILFHGPELKETIEKPKLRSSSQKYIFASVESANNYPICLPEYERFFNWTWTYRLNSNIVWSAFTVRDIRSGIVAPNENVEWINNTQPLNNKLKKLFLTRRKAAACFVSNCGTKSRREVYILKLEAELRKRGLRLDIFGKCGLRLCPKRNQTMQDCEEMLRRDYYFYLAFENSFSEDYVTEKVLHGYSNYVVPIVYGAAKYTSFLPPHSYINALQMDAAALADVMKRSIEHPQIYDNFFRWTNSYIIQASDITSDSHPYCKLCAALQNHGLTEPGTVYNEFRNWWNDPSVKGCSL